MSEMEEMGKDQQPSAKQQRSSLPSLPSFRTISTAFVMACCAIMGYAIVAAPFVGHEHHAGSTHLVFTLSDRLFSAQPWARHAFTLTHWVSAALCLATAFSSYMMRLLLVQQIRTESTRAGTPVPVGPDVTPLPSSSSARSEGTEGAAQSSAAAHMEARDQGIEMLQAQASIADVCVQICLLTALTLVACACGVDPLAPRFYRTNTVFPILWEAVATHCILGQACIVKLAARQVEDVEALVADPPPAATTQVHAAGRLETTGQPVKAAAVGQQEGPARTGTASSEISYSLSDAAPLVILRLLQFSMHCIPYRVALPINVTLFALLLRTMVSERAAFFTAVLAWDTQGMDGTGSKTVPGPLYDWLETCSRHWLTLASAIYALMACIPDTGPDLILAVRGAMALACTIDSCSLLTIVLLNRGMALEERKAYGSRLSLERAKIQLHREAEQRKNHFLRFVFHEARMPLHSVSMALEALADMPRDGESETEGCQHVGSNGRSMPPAVVSLRDGQDGREDAAELIQLAQASCESVRVIMNSLLTLSAIEAQAFKIVPRPASLRGMLRTTVAQLQPHAKGIGAQLELVMGEGTPPDEMLLEFDPVRLGQVVTNLVSNALKFVPQDGGGRVTVSVSVTVDSTGVDGASMHSSQLYSLRIAVTDNGMGIPVEEQAKLFRPYQQVTSGGAQVGAGTGKREFGTGLGLSISQEIVKQHGGTIGLSSEPGQGSTFWFDLRLPVARTLGPLQGLGQQRRQSTTEGKDGSVAQQAYTKTQDTSLSLEPIRLLVVDDSDGNRRLLARLLQRRFPAAQVDQAADGQAGLEAAKAALSQGEPYSAILMDGNMPIMDGYAATAAIRAVGYSGRLIGVTGNALAEDQQRFISSGADAVLTKPVSTDQVAKACMAVYR